MVLYATLRPLFMIFFTSRILCRSQRDTGFTRTRKSSIRLPPSFARLSKILILMFRRKTHNEIRIFRIEILLESYYILLLTLFKELTWRLITFWKACYFKKVTIRFYIDAGVESQGNVTNLFCVLSTLFNFKEKCSLYERQHCWHYMRYKFSNILTSWRSHHFITYN